MSDPDLPLHVIYLLGALVLAVSALAARRLPIASVLKMFVGWVLIFAVAFIIFTFKDDFLALGDRLLLAARGGEIEATVPGEARIRQSPDGHFWVNAEVNGQNVRFLVDSGATTTSISTATARRLGIEAGGMPIPVRTANGMVTVQRGRADLVRIGEIERRAVAVHVSDAFGDLNVIGMNLLSSFRSWGVEDRTLVLRS